MNGAIKKNLTATIEHSLSKSDWIISLLTIAALLFIWFEKQNTKYIIDWLSFVPAVIASVILFFIGFFYSIKHRGIRDLALSKLSFAFAQAVIFSNLLAICNYLAFAFKRPLIDAYLTHIDAALGFDWVAYTNFFKQN